ncbi:hypothetical protein RvY_01698 [Ramazzottius varieornatus]|uniref:DDE-1 domain-containing protein n=1 Tax=Ramazzottius varieornatus TaxID=947166 RepID=A0A1D1UPA3_RAMVA|nr:hypothetical protein RvY_01698 [Ramazzottius varieornatus]
MTKELFVEWCEKVFFPQMDGYCLFLVDSWPTFADQKAVEEVKPEELEYEMITIPPKVTGQIQPLDVLRFRMYKGYFRKVSNWIFLNDQPVQVHHRDVILMLHSLIYQQFTSLGAAILESGDERQKAADSAKTTCDPTDLVDTHATWKSDSSMTFQLF